MASMIGEHSGACRLMSRRSSFHLVYYSWPLLRRLRSYRRSLVSLKSPFPPFQKPDFYLPPCPRPTPRCSYGIFAFYSSLGAKDSLFRFRFGIEIFLPLIFSRKFPLVSEGTSFPILTPQQALPSSVELPFTSIQCFSRQVPFSRSLAKPDYTRSYPPLLFFFCFEKLLLSFRFTRKGDPRPWSRELPRVPPDLRRSDFEGPIASCGEDRSCLVRFLMTSRVTVSGR